MAARDDEVLAHPPSRALVPGVSGRSTPETSLPRAPRRSARVRAAIGGVLLLGLLGLATAVVGAIVTPGGTSTTVAAGGAAPESGSSDPGGAPSSSDGASSASAPPATAVIVHVLGAVREPGIVEVRPGDRVVDAIAAAGGTTDDADLAGVNLARVLVDGEQLRVPRAGEVVVPPPASGAPAAGGASGADGAAAGLVNINTADAAALEALPGVGPALAARIIAWREENGSFRAVDELLAVSGIGESTLDGMRDQVAL